MSDYVHELETYLLGLPTGEPVTATDLLRALRPIAQALEEVARHRDTLAETVGFVNQLQDRLALVDTLPAAAPFGAMLRLTTGGAAVRGPVYIGNGPSQPLTRIVPVALP